MLKQLLSKLENPLRPLLGPNVKALEFWGLLLPKNILTKYFYLFMHFAVTVFTALEYVDVWFVKSNMSLLLNNLKITMLATVSVCKVTSFLYWLKHWKDIIEYVTRADLYQRITKDPIKIQMIKNFTQYCRKITFLYWLLMYTTVVILIFQPVFKYFCSSTYRENVKNGTKVYLEVISSWVPFDKSTITGYLAASAYQSYAAVYGGGWITSFDTTAMVIMVFFKAELELLRIDSANIFGTEKNPVPEKVAMKSINDCHRRHVELCKLVKRDR
ncbi:Odorant receptor [Operophtera brumata]|uniref:Odorant receptor n=1 Tax=Operophtera brumata TaxID=104452 RepID=A0A0L7LII6_OPEBR|nr:Odorant receptor [Operophtera brumata]